MAAATAGAALALFAEASTAVEAASSPDLTARTTPIDDDYDLGAKIGAGAYANVFVGTCRKTGEQFAIKVIPRQRGREGSAADAQIRREVSILERVSMHKCIAKLEAFYETPNAFYVVMEYVSGGELLEHLCEHGALTEKQAVNLFQEIGGAVALLHAQGLCHADIKPENLLLTADKKNVKLVDFGLSGAFERQGNGGKKSEKR